jgi:hypothetical protein
VRLLLTTRFSVPVLPTAGFDRLLLALNTICLAQAGQRIDPGPEIAGNLANVDWVTAMIGPAGWTSPGCHYWWVVHPAVRTFGTMRQ